MPVRQQLATAPVWLAIALCFAIPVYAHVLAGAPPDDVSAITLVIGTVMLSAWLSLPQILAALLIHANHRPVVRWALLALSIGATLYVGQMISFPFKTASSMATAHVFAPIYGTVGVAMGAIVVLAVERWFRNTLSRSI